MSLDQYFKELKVETEEDLYKKSFRSAALTRAQIEEELVDEQKEARRRFYAREILWLFGALFFGILLGYAVNTILPEGIKSSLNNTLTELIEVAGESGSIESAIGSVKDAAAAEANNLTGGGATDAVDNLANQGGDALAQGSEAAMSEGERRGLLYLLMLICFVGVYVTRLVKWSMFKIIGQEE